MTARIPASPTRISGGLAWVLLLVVALAASRGGVLILAALGLAGAVVAVATASQLKLPVLLVWLAAGGLLYPVVIYPVGSPVITLDRMAGAFLLLALVSTKEVRSRVRPSGRLGLCGAWLVVAFGLRAATTSVGQGYALALWVDGILVPAVAFAATRRLVRNRADADRVMVALTILGTSVAAIGILAKIIGLDLASRTGGRLRLESSLSLVRVSGPYPEPEVFGVVLVVCLAATLYWMMACRPSLALSSVAISLQLAAIGLTFFRAMWLATAVVVLIVVGSRPGRLGRGAMTFIAGCVVVVGLLFAFSGSTTVTARIENRDSLSGRADIYRVAVRLFRQAPLTGVGVGQFVPAELRLPASTLPTSAYGVLFPHSSFFGTLAEQGLMGFAPLMATFVAAGALLLQARKRWPVGDDATFVAAAIGAALAYTFVSLSLTMISYGPSNIVLAVLIGAVAARLDAEPKEAAASRSVHHVRP